MTKAAMLQVDQVDFRALSDNQLHIPGEESRPNRSSGKPRSGYVHHPHHQHHRRLYQKQQDEKPQSKVPSIVHATPVIQKVEPPTPSDPLSANDPFEQHFLAAAALTPPEKPVRASSFRDDKAKPVVKKRRDSDGNYSSSPNLLFPKDDLQVDAGQGGDAPLRRVRSFKTSSKGAILNRGDSFRKKSSNRNLASGSTVEKGQETPRLETGGVSAPDLQVSHHRDASLPSYFKVQILGALGCGKTSIANQFMSSDFANAFESMNVDDVERTVTIQLDGDEFTMEFLDAPEEEDPDEDDNIEVAADSYVVVYSITDKNSFDTAVQILYRLRHCMDSDRPIVLVGNKADLVRKRKVKKEEVLSISKTYDCLHYETSAALNHHVDELLVAILKQIRHKLAPDVFPLAPEQACEVKKVSKGPMNFFVRLFRKMSGKGGSERK